MKILAAITTYNPQISRLRENINSVIKQVDGVLIYDNHSENIIMIDELIKDYSSITVKKNYQNNGIANSLAFSMQYAIYNNFTWVLALDQDSVVLPNLISEYIKYCDLEKVGMLTCNIIDRNFVQNRNFSDTPYMDIKYCITSGSFINVKAYLDSDGYDEKMFIDSVDFDICINLRQHGYKIYQINFDGLLHEVGVGKNVSLFGRKEISFGHSPLRNYYQARNILYLYRKYPSETSLLKIVLREIKREMIILIFEDDRLKKVKARWKGLLDSKKMKNTNN